MDQGDIAQQLARLEAKIDRLRKSDRQQWQRIQTQQRHVALFGGIVALGVLLGIGGLTAEDRASLQQVLVATVVAAGGAGGIIGVNSIPTKPPLEDGEDAD
jgi:hypothetical protein